MIQDLIAGYGELSVLFPLTICLLSNYVHRIEEIKAHNAQRAQSSKQGTSMDMVGNTEDSREMGNAVRDNGATVGSDTAPKGNGVNREDGAPREKWKKKVDNIGHKW